MTRLWIVVAALALGGCVAERMERMTGHPVADVEQRFGPPAKVADITATTRIYTWTRRADLKAAPPPVSVFQPLANGQFYKVHRSYSRGTYCEFRVLASHRPGDGVWIVSRVYNPGLKCD